METYKMTCDKCFYGSESYHKSPAYGRNKKGEEIEDETMSLSSLTCIAEPAHKVVSAHCYDGYVPDICAEPEFHTCGRGRWWEGGKWIRLIDAEDAGLED